LHPYTQGVIGSQPGRARPGQVLQSIEGQLPSLSQLPDGCRFHPRCRHAADICRDGVVELETAAPGHALACRRWRDLAVSA
jgi:oligopeptide/dipeptide ABC transporter ATP-binding protein